MTISNTSSRPITAKNSSVSSRQHGRDIDQRTGSQTIAHGSNAAATTAIASLTTVTMATLARSTGSSSTTNHIWSLADFRGSSTTVFGSVWLIRGQGLGQTTGTRPTTFTLSTPTMDITCTTAGILRSALRSTSRYKALSSAGPVEVALTAHSRPPSLGEKACLPARSLGSCTITGESKPQTS